MKPTSNRWLLSGYPTWDGRLRTARTSPPTPPVPNAPTSPRWCWKNDSGTPSSTSTQTSPPSALETGLRSLINPDGPTLEARNRSFHHALTRGVTVPVRRPDGTTSGEPAAVVDFDNPANNDWMAVNQVTVKENQSTRRADIVLFLNGLPLGIIELKNPADENADVWDAWNQLQTYKADLPTLFSMNEIMMVSDGLHARVGTLTAGKEWFKPWKTMEDREPGAANLPELQVMLEGVCEQSNFLTLLRDFIVFDDDGSGKLVKKMAGYHQFHAVQAAVEETLRATELQEIASRIATRHGGAPGDRRIGVVWHNQGSGKSLTMAFYAGAIIREPAMNNPTIVVLTDRNDLDDQLFGTFSRCRDLLRQNPSQADSRADLRSKLSVNVGGVVFTTIQKFFPEERGDSHPVLSDRRNIVVIADEAHPARYACLSPLSCPRTGTRRRTRAGRYGRPHITWCGSTPKGGIRPPRTSWPTWAPTRRLRATWPTASIASAVILLYPWLEYLKYRILPKVLQLGFPAAPSATGSEGFQQCHVGEVHRLGNRAGASRR